MARETPTVDELQRELALTKEVCSALLKCFAGISQAVIAQRLNVVEDSTKSQGARLGTIERSVKDLGDENAKLRQRIDTASTLHAKLRQKVEAMEAPQPHAERTTA
jgi:septal ring factor EnvC (AmiA/AmiB activator)